MHFCFSFLHGAETNIGDPTEEPGDYQGGGTKFGIDMQAERAGSQADIAARVARSKE